MAKTMASWGQCLICGGRVRADNKYGICNRTPACWRTRLEKDRRAAGVSPKKRGRSICKVERCEEIVHAHGLCSTHSQRARNNNGDPGTAERRKWTRVEIKTGAVFDRWTAAEDYGQDLSDPFVLCRCECGTERKVRAHQLVAGSTRSCGCRRRGSRPKPDVPYLAVGTVSGGLTALEDAWKSADRIWFRCECGSESERVAVSVGSGGTVSCGCRPACYKHGLSQHPLYGSWAAMLERTTNPASDGYRSYGARGISVCERWQGPDGLRNFIADVGERPVGMTLDRIDNDGDYRPGNVRWATPKQQARNRRTVAALTAQRDSLLDLVASLRAEADCRA